MAMAFCFGVVFYEQFLTSLGRKKSNNNNTSVNVQSPLSLKQLLSDAEPGEAVHPWLVTACTAQPLCHTHTPHSCILIQTHAGDAADSWGHLFRRRILPDPAVENGLGLGCGLVWFCFVFSRIFPAPVRLPLLLRTSTLKVSTNHT